MLTKNSKKALALFVCVTGITCIDIYQAHLQINISTERFGPNGEMFEQLHFIILAQKVICLIWSFIITRVQIRFYGNNGAVPFWICWRAGLIHTIVPAMGFKALKHINYPAQVLTMSSQIPVKLIGYLLYEYGPIRYGHRYGPRYDFAGLLGTFLVIGGMSTYAHLKTSSFSHPNTGLVLILSLDIFVFDAFTIFAWKSIKFRFQNADVWNIMLGMNLWGTIYSLIDVFVWPNGNLYDAVRFCQQHPEAARYILYYCLCAAVSQNFMFLTRDWFGASPFYAIDFTRMYSSTFVSLWRENPISNKQFGCFLMGYSVIMLQSIYCRKKSPREEMHQLREEIHRMYEMDRMREMRRILPWLICPKPRHVNTTMAYHG